MNGPRYPVPAMVINWLRIASLPLAVLMLGAHLLLLLLRPTLADGIAFSLYFLGAVGLTLNAGIRGELIRKRGQPPVASEPITWRIWLKLLLLLLFIGYGCAWLFHWLNLGLDAATDRAMGFTALGAGAYYEAAQSATQVLRQRRGVTA